MRGVGIAKVILAPSTRTSGVRPKHTRGAVASRRAAGHTIVELLIVAAIILCVTALSLPTMNNVISSSKLRSGMGELSGIFQTCRSQAVKQNKIKELRFQVTGGRTIAFVDDAVNAGLSSSTPQIWLPAEFSKVDEPAGGEGAPPALDAVTMWGSNSTDTPNSTNDTFFNQLGVPCTYNTGSGVCTGAGASGFVYYFTYSGSMGTTQWAAIGVSPAGRIKTWFWDGSLWKN
jgi:Tfp pilus assembly protein FimT